MWQLLSGVFVLLEITLQASISRDTSYTSPVTLTQPQSRMNFIDTSIGQAYILGEKDSTVSVISTQGKSIATVNPGLYSSFMTIGKNPSFPCALIRGTLDSTTLPTSLPSFAVYQLTSLSSNQPLTDPVKTRAFTTTNPVGSTGYNPATAGTSQSQSYYIYMIIRDGYIQRIDYTVAADSTATKGSLISTQAFTGTRLVIDAGNPTGLHLTDSQNIIRVDYTTLAQAASYAKPCAGDSADSFFSQNNNSIFYHSTSGASSTASSYISSCDISSGTRARTLVEFTSQTGKIITDLREFGGAFHLALAIVSDRVNSNIMVLWKDDLSVLVSSQLDYGIRAGSVLAKNYTISGDKVTYPIFGLTLTSSGSSFELSKFTFVDVPNECVYSGQCAPPEIVSKEFWPSTGTLTITFKTPVPGQNFSLYLDVYPVDERGNRIRSASFRYTGMSSDKTKLYYTLYAAKNLNKFFIVVNYNDLVDGSSSSRKYPGHFQESYVDATSYNPYENGNKSETFSGAYNLTTIQTTQTALTTVGAAGVVTSSISGVTGVMRISSTIKVIDSLQYILYENGGRIALSEKFLQPFKRNPIQFFPADVDFNFIPESEINCVPHFNFAKENVGCNFINNYGKQVITLGGCFAMYWLMRLVVALLSKTLVDWWIAITIRAILFIPTKLFTSKLVAGLLDGYQIEMLQYAFLNIRYSSTNAYQLLGLFFSIVVIILYIGYGVCIYIYTRDKVNYITGRTDTSRMMDKMHYFGYLFEDYKDRCHFNYTFYYYIPLMRLARTFIIQICIIFMAGQGMDQVRLIFMIELFFLLLAIFCNHLKSTLLKYVNILICGVFCLIQLVLLVHEADIEKYDRQKAYGVTLIVLYSIVLLNELLGILHSLWISIVVMVAKGKQFIQTHFGKNRQKKDRPEKMYALDRNKLFSHGHHKKGNFLHTHKARFDPETLEKLVSLSKSSEKVSSSVKKGLLEYLRLSKPNSVSNSDKRLVVDSHGQSTANNLPNDGLDLGAELAAPVPISHSLIPDTADRKLPSPPSGPSSNYFISDSYGYPIHKDGTISDGIHIQSKPSSLFARNYSEMKKIKISDDEVNIEEVKVKPTSYTNYQQQQQQIQSRGPTMKQLASINPEKPGYPISPSPEPQEFDNLCITPDIEHK